MAEVRRVLTLVQAGKISLQDKSKRPTTAAERLLGTALAAPDFDLELPPDAVDAHRFGSPLTAGPVRAHAWAVVVQQCGWCKARGNTLTLTNAGKQLAAGFDLDAYRHGIEQLGGDDVFDELNRINHIRGQNGKGKRYLTDPAARREAILMSLCEWPVGQWIEVAEAYRFAFASGNPFLTTTEPMSLYFCEQQYGYLTDHDDVNRQYFRAALFETLATLGLVDVAYVYPHYLWPELSGNWGIDDMDFCGRYDGLLYVRLNRSGRLLPGRDGPVRARRPCRAATCSRCWPITNWRSAARTH